MFKNRPDRFFFLPPTREMKNPVSLELADSRCERIFSVPVTSKIRLFLRHRRCEFPAVPKIHDVSTTYRKLIPCGRGNKRFRAHARMKSWRSRTGQAGRVITAEQSAMSSLSVLNESQSSRLRNRKLAPVVTCKAGQGRSGGLQRFPGIYFMG